MSNICDFDRILKTECNLQHFTRNCKIKNLDDFERDEADKYLWWAFVVFGNIFERKDSKCCAVLIKHRRKVKDEQVITLQKAQQLKTKKINDVPEQLFCR